MKCAGRRNALKALGALPGWLALAALAGAGVASWCSGAGARSGPRRTGHRDRLCARRRPAHGGCRLVEHLSTEALKLPRVGYYRTFSWSKAPPA
ncbi:hypothetical protein ACTMU2_00845 [Cupriavidus basilensis]